jgi:Ala-tRNA(Pro) deacylase
LPSQQKAVLEWLEANGALYEVEEHPPVYTMEDMENLGITQRGTGCKNLFLRDAKGRRHILVTLRGDKRADLAAIAARLNATRLSFASADRLMRFLGLPTGAVSPLGVLNDSDAAVEVAFDRDLAGLERVGVHPNENTATVWLPFDDLRRLIEGHGNKVSLIEI